MTTETPIHLVLAAFSTEDAAASALSDLDEMRKRGDAGVKNVAIVTKDSQSHVHVSEPGDRGFGRGALAGGLVGAVVGILAGPIGWSALGGAAIGGIAADAVDSGFRDERLQEIGEGLQPASSALVARVEPVDIEAVERSFEDRGADLVTSTISSDMAGQLDELAKIAR
jgi:uncharacterized membrane protein